MWLPGLCITWRLVGGCLEVLISQATASPLQKNHFLSVVSDVAQILPRMCVIRNSTAGHFDDLAFSFFAGTLCLGTTLTMAGENMSLIAQMKQCPVVSVTSQDNVTAITAVTAVRSSFRYIFFPAEVRGTATTLS